MRIGELAGHLGASLEAVISALYDLAKTDQKLMIINPGCDQYELDMAEQRIGYSLHPLHRFLLGISNGGSLPYGISLNWMAAAIPREPVWDWTPSRASASERHTTAVSDVASGPFRPLLLGQSVRDWYGPYILEKLDLETFIFLASGYDGQCFGYARDTAGHIDVVHDMGREIKAADFEVFVRNLSLSEHCATPEFAGRMRGALA